MNLYDINGYKLSRAHPHSYSLWSGYEYQNIISFQM